MAIDYQSGSGAVAQKGQEAGEARIHEQQRAANNERKMRLDLENIQYQATLQKAMMQQQMDIEQESRAKAWEIEKMETRSRLDFQKDEKVRIKKETQYESGVEEIKKRSRAVGGFLSPEDTEKFLFQHAMQYQGTNLADKALGLGLSPTDQAIQNALNNKNGTPGTPGTPEGQARTESAARGGLVETDQGYLVETPGRGLSPLAPTGMVRIVTPSGAKGTIPASQLNEALANGYQFLGVAPTNIVKPKVDPQAQGPKPLTKVQQARVDRGIGKDSFNLVEAIAGSKPELAAKAISRLVGQSEEERLKNKAKRKKLFGFMDHDFRGTARKNYK